MGDLVIKKGAEVCMLVECHRGCGDLELSKAHGDVALTGILEKPGRHGQAVSPRATSTHCELGHSPARLSVL